MQKQPSRGVLRKRFSENMRQIYRRTPMPKCDFKKIAKKLFWYQTSAWVLSCKFAAYFQNTFPSEHLWTTAYADGNTETTTNQHPIRKRYSDNQESWKIWKQCEGRTKPSYVKWYHASSYELENFCRNSSFELLTRLHKILT